MCTCSNLFYLLLRWDPIHEVDYQFLISWYIKLSMWWSKPDAVCEFYLGMNGNDSVILKFHHKYLEDWPLLEIPLELNSIKPYKGILFDEVSVFGTVANMMNGCISHIYPNFWKCDFTRKWLQETGPHAGQTNVNVFLKKPMHLIQNGILKKSTMCLILCNIHVCTFSYQGKSRPNS